MAGHTAFGGREGPVLYRNAQRNRGAIVAGQRNGCTDIKGTALKARFIAVPKVDYVGTKGKIESLNTQTLAEHIDERFIEFYDTKKNDALALGR